jgi:hypothetical protein
MASENLMADVRKGMEVHAADGQKLGKVTQIWIGEDPTATNPRCDEDVCSRLEVHQGFLGRTVLFVPYSAVAYVTSDAVHLNVDGAKVGEHAWTHKPAWIAN